MKLTKVINKQQKCPTIMRLPKLSTKMGLTKMFHKKETHKNVPQKLSTQNQIPQKISIKMKLTKMRQK